MPGNDSKHSGSLTQVQIIQSLADALAWFEREINRRIDPAELRHLTGRIGELYAAMITRGLMAPKVNQRGYDVVGANGHKISVKTITSSGHVSFRKSTLSEADRVMILRINIHEDEVSIEEIVDVSIPEIISRCQQTTEGYRYSVPARNFEQIDPGNLKILDEVIAGNWRIGQLENGTVFVEADGKRLAVVKPTLREIANLHGVSLLNGNGGPKNTRQLGTDIIAILKGKTSTEVLVNGSTTHSP